MQSHDELATIRPAATPFPLTTANGRIWIDQEADVFVAELNLWIVVAIYKDAVCLLSLGQLCMLNFFDFIWCNLQFPFLQKSGGRKVLCRPYANTPLLGVQALAAAGGQGVEEPASRKKASNPHRQIARSRLRASPDADGEVAGALKMSHHHWWMSPQTTC